MKTRSLRNSSFVRPFRAFSMTSMWAVPVALSALFSGACDLVSNNNNNNNNNNNGNNNNAPGSLAQSSLSRELNPQVADADLSALVDGNTAFSFDLYKAIKDDEANANKNIFYSPYSISLALSMAYAGAANNTATQMASALHFLDPAAQHNAFNRLALDLATRGRNIDPETGADPFRLSVVNDMWGQIGYDFLPNYLDTLALNYGAGLRLLDFLQDPEGSRVLINDYIADNTNDRIQNLLPNGSVTPDTRLVLTNAIFFKASWATAFDKANTRDAPFHNADGTTNDAVPTMRQATDAGYASFADYQVIELPYAGNELAMTIVVPDAGVFADVEATFDDTAFQESVDALIYNNILLDLPKFTFTQDLPLADTLQELGMTDAFSSAADFSNIDGTTNLVISDVLHKAFVAVDETGTEAAAATAVVFEDTAIAPEPLEVNIDRPFLFYVRDVVSGTVLFAGRVVTL